MNRLKLLLLTTILLVPILLAPSVIVGQTDNSSSTNIKYEDINPKNGYRYLLKRMKEKVVLLILSTNSQKKLDYYEKLLNIRLSELKYIVDNKDISNIQVASQRYFTTAGQMTEFLKSKNELTLNKERVKGLFTEHIKIIEFLKTAYPNTTAEWRFLRDDANYLIDYSSLLKK